MNQLSNEEKISLAAEWIANSKHLVAFTGAGISTESGIPDFRGPNGVWTRKDKGLPPPRMKKVWSEIEPNIGHKVLVELQNLGLLKYLITQNTDNLHLRSGIKPELLSELHGNGEYMFCLDCQKKMTYDEAKWDKALWGPGYRTSPVRVNQPNCPFCHGRIISSVVNFGDPLPEFDYKKAYEHSEDADVYLIVGSSLVVFPAADLPDLALKNKAKLILINIGDTPFDKKIDIKIGQSIGETLIKILEKVKSILK